jgi:hypothetical protein
MPGGIGTSNCLEVMSEKNGEAENRAKEANKEVRRYQQLH